MLCIEVLSPRDSLRAMREQVQDDFDMGVPTVWIFDPRTRTAHDWSNAAMTEHGSGSLSLAGTPVKLSVDAVFQTLDAQAADGCAKGKDPAIVAGSF